MKTLTFCAMVIAVSTFATAVEDLYGWSNVQPVATAAWDAAYGWGTEIISADARTEPTNVQ